MGKDKAPLCPKGCSSLPMRHIENNGYFCMHCKLHLKKPDYVHPAVVAYERDKLETQVRKLQDEVIQMKRIYEQHEKVLKSLIEALGYKETFHNQVVKKRSSSGWAD